MIIFKCYYIGLFIRSTPCPHVKHSDEWGEPTSCESADNCPYCHTRTEQQFHPEVNGKPTNIIQFILYFYCIYYLDL